MIQPLIKAHRIVPHFTPSKRHKPKMRKLIRTPVRQLTQSYAVLNLLMFKPKWAETSFTNSSYMLKIGICSQYGLDKRF